MKDAPQTAKQTASAGSREEVVQLVEKGRSQIRHSKREAAFETFRAVLSKDPGNTEALTGIGRVWGSFGVYDSAITYYSQAIQQDSTYLDAYNGLANVRYYLFRSTRNPRWVKNRMPDLNDPARYSREQYDSALALYTRAIGIDSSYVESFTNRGAVKETFGDMQGALEDYSLAIRHNPQHASAYRLRGLVYHSQKKYEEAIADFTSSIELGMSSYTYNPEIHYANCYVGRANSYFEAKDYEKAIADYTSALENNPRHMLAILNRSISLVELNQPDSALVGLHKVVKNLSNTEYNQARGLAFIQLGNIYKSKGDFERSIAKYKKAKDTPFYAARGCWGVAACYSLMKDLDKAIKWLEKSVAYGFSDMRRWRQNRDFEFLWDKSEFKRFFE